MADEDRPLTSEERAELEELRAERARRQQAEQDRRDREELERLRAERDGAAGGRGESQPVARRGKAQRARRVRTVTPEEAAQIERDRQVRERNAKLMEPDDDLSMPIGQKIALVGIFAFAIIAVLAIVFGPK